MPLDIALGFLGAVMQAVIGREDLTVRLLVLGAVFALLPDLDFLVSALRKRSIAAVDHTHRELLHHPVPYLALGGLIVWLLAPQYTLLFMGLSLAHFVHDSMGVGWGIPWLSPLSLRHAKLFTDRANRPSWKSVAIFWRKDERDALIKRHHNPDWIRDTYAHLSATAVIEGVSFLLALLCAFLLTSIL